MTELTFQSHTTADGIPGNSIHAIVIDNQNDIWCGTSYGVGYYNGKTWQSFSTIDGLAGDLVVQIVNENLGISGSLVRLEG